jgi:hypothetical protein
MYVRRPALPHYTTCTVQYTIRIDITYLSMHEAAFAAYVTMSMLVAFATSMLAACAAIL